MKSESLYMYHANIFTWFKVDICILSIYVYDEKLISVSYQYIDMMKYW